MADTIQTLDIFQQQRGLPLQRTELTRIQPQIPPEGQSDSVEADATSLSYVWVDTTLLGRYKG